MCIRDSLWNGVFNNGEWGITSGPSLTGHEVACPAFMPIGEIGFGIPNDDADVFRYLMWTEEQWESRFNVTFDNSADHLVGVFFENGQWKVDRNGIIVDFEPRPTDCILGELNGINDTVTLYEGQNLSVFGIPAGYPAGNLTVQANTWNGVPNQGEWYPQGTNVGCLLYTSPSPRDATLSRMPSSA